MTPLINLIFKKDLTGLQKAIESGIDLDEQDRGGRTALMQASTDGQLQIVTALLNAGANPNLQDRGGFTALHFAAQNYFPEVVSALIENGAIVDVPDGFGNTALGRATFDSRGRGDVIKVLLRAGADPQLKNKHGVSPKELANTIANYNIAQFFE